MFKAITKVKNLRYVLNHSWKRIQGLTFRGADFLDGNGGISTGCRVGGEATLGGLISVDDCSCGEDPEASRLFSGGVDGLKLTVCRARGIGNPSLSRVPFSASSMDEVEDMSETEAGGVQLVLQNHRP